MTRLLANVTLLIGLLSLAASAQMPWGTVDFRGTLGESQIGMLFDLGSNSEIPDVFSGSYFYTKYLKDIPLEGKVLKDGTLVLFEKNTSGATQATFQLKPYGKNDTNVDFRNSIGLKGSWTASDGRILPVKLSMEDALIGTAANRYGGSPNSTEIIEGHARRFLAAVQRGDHQAASKEVVFPLSPPNGKLIRNVAQLDQQWNMIFTPSYLACLKTLVPHNLFTNYRGSMMGAGTVWLDSRGIFALNPC